MLVETINLHVWPRCNLACSYCYGHFPDVRTHLSGDDWLPIIDLIAEAGVRRVTFSGGEPTLHPDLGAMLFHAKSRGLQTSIITNATRLTEEHIAVLDVIGMTLDAASPELLHRIGRGRGYGKLVRRVAEQAHTCGVFLKINTVVTTQNAREDLSESLMVIRPDKWKPMQFVFVPGENDGVAPELAIDEATFDAFVERHRAVRTFIPWVEPEDANTIRTTYVMVDPLGRLFRSGAHAYIKSDPIVRVGLRRALEQVGGYDRAAFESRGGHVDLKRRLHVIREVGR